MFSGPAEAVVTYIGSKRKNMGNSQRKEVADTGRGPVGETAVTGANDRETNLVVARVVQSTDAETPQGFAKDHTDSRATTHTDDPKVQGSLSSDRDSVQRSQSDQRKGDEHANGMERPRSLLKGTYAATFHKLSPEPPAPRVQELAGRHNMWDLNGIDRVKGVRRG